jgi:MoxR-like ATPase
MARKQVGIPADTRTPDYMFAIPSVSTAGLRVTAIKREPIDNNPAVFSQSALLGSAEFKKPLLGITDASFWRYAYNGGAHMAQRVCDTIAKGVAALFTKPVLDSLEESNDVLLLTSEAELLPVIPKEVLSGKALSKEAVQTLMQHSFSLSYSDEITDKILSDKGIGVVLTVPKSMVDKVGTMLQQDNLGAVVPAYSLFEGFVEDLEASFKAVYGHKSNFYPVGNDIDVITDLSDDTKSAEIWGASLYIGWLKSFKKVTYDAGTGYRSTAIIAPTVGSVSPKTLLGFSELGSNVLFFASASRPHAHTSNAPARVGKSLVETLLDDCPIPAKEVFHVLPLNWKLLLRNVATKKPTLLTGVSGTGKTELLMLLAKSLGLTLHIIDMGSTHDPLSALLGVHRLRNEDGLTVSYFEKAKLPNVVATPCLIVLDELTRASPAANNILLPMLDSRRCLPMSIASGELTDLQLHKDCVVFGTANIGLEYSGTNALDRALADRFSILEIALPDKDAEATLLVAKFGIELSMANRIIRFADKLRANVDYTTHVSMRSTQEVASLIRDGFMLKEAIETAWLPLFLREERSQIMDTLKTLGLT